MNGPGHYLFARPCFSADQYRAATLAHQLNDAEHLIHHAALAHQKLSPCGQGLRGLLTAALSATSSAYICVMRNFNPPDPGQISPKTDRRRLHQRTAPELPAHRDQQSPPNCRPRLISSSSSSGVQSGSGKSLQSCCTLPSRIAWQHSTPLETRSTCHARSGRAAPASAAHGSADTHRISWLLEDTTCPSIGRCRANL